MQDCFEKKYLIGEFFEILQKLTERNQVLLCGYAAGLWAAQKNDEEEKT